jgi:hypothetical protein
LGQIIIPIFLDFNHLPTLKLFGPITHSNKIAMFIKNLKFSKKSDILIHKIKIKKKKERESLSEQRREDERNKKKKTPARFSNGCSEEEGTVSIQTERPKEREENRFSSC